MWQVAKFLGGVGPWPFVRCDYARSTNKPLFIIINRKTARVSANRIIITPRKGLTHLSWSNVNVLDCRMCANIDKIWICGMVTDL